MDFIGGGLVDVVGAGKRRTSETSHQFVRRLGRAETAKQFVYFVPGAETTSTQHIANIAMNGMGAGWLPNRLPGVINKLSIISTVE